MNYFNYEKPSHFTCDCIESNVKYNQIHFYNAFVSSCLMLAEAVPFQTIDSATIDHITKDYNAFCRLFFEFERDQKDDMIGQGILSKII